MKHYDVVKFAYEGISLVLTLTGACVYLMPKLRGVTSVYLVALNLVDTVCGTVVVWSGVWGNAGGPDSTKSLAYNYLTVVGTQFLAISTRRVVCCLSAVVSLERFLVITFPLKARLFTIIRFPKLTVAAVITTVFAFHVFLPLKYTVVESSAGGYRNGYTDLYRTNEDAFDAISNVATYAFSYFPLFAGLCLSVALLVALRRHAASRKKLQEGGNDEKAQQLRKQERQLALTIWLSTSLFTMLSLPNNAAHIASLYHETFGNLKLDHYLYGLVSRLSYLAIITTRYTNFFSYLGLSTAFRQSLIRALCPRKVSRRLLRAKNSRPWLSGVSGDGSDSAERSGQTQTSTIVNTVVNDT